MTEWMNERMIRWKDEWMDGPLLVSNTNNDLIKMYESYSIMFILTTGQFLWQNGHVVVLTLALPRVNNLKNTVLERCKNYFTQKVTTRWPASAAFNSGLITRYQK